MPSPSTAVGTTAAEAEVLAATAAAIAAGQDPFGDDDTDDTPATDTAADEDTSDDTDQTEDTADESTDDGGQADDDNAEDDSTEDRSAATALRSDEAHQADEAPLFKAQSPAEFKAKRDELLAKRAKAFKDYSDGVIEPEEYSRIDTEVFDALEQLTVQRTLHTANTQRAADAWDSALDTVIEAAKGAGTIDYRADEVAAKQFDVATAMLKADGKQRTAAQLANDAHKAVLALRGVAAATTEPKPEPAKARENGKPPVTLRNVPAAEVPNAGGGWQEAIGKLSGQEYEEAFARLTPAQKSQLLGD